MAGRICRSWADGALRPDLGVGDLTAVVGRQRRRGGSRSGAGVA
ncbi:hypothetical protein [Actinocatenispora rupis]|nr:hypothetical protein [Actinocatenispora rupis]